MHSEKLWTFMNDLTTASRRHWNDGEDKDRNYPYAAFIQAIVHC